MYQYSRHSVLLFLSIQLEQEHCLDYCFSQMPKTISSYYGVKQLPVLNNSCGRIVNYGHTVDILKDHFGKFKIVEHKCEVETDKYPIVNLIFSYVLALIVSVIIVFVFWSIAKAFLNDQDKIINYLGMLAFPGIIIGVIYSFFGIPEALRDSFKRNHCICKLLPIKTIWEQD